ncbi:MAG: hypothetical protein KGD63_12005 [Candidatus Lokiarchaeota archaeon]|nr:hypothetical protein [Candidatus Lokiarchaeota archaeon]
MSSIYKYKVLIGGLQTLDNIPFLNNTDMEKRDFLHIGISIKPVECLTNHCDSYLFIFWSLSRAKKFEFMNSSFCYGARGAILCLDKSDLTSLKDVNYWIDTIKSTIKDIPIIIVIYQSNPKKKEVSEDNINKILKNKELKHFTLRSPNREMNHIKKCEFFKFLVLKLNYDSPIYLEDFSIIFPTEEKKFQQFSNSYILCPICKNKNHIHNLKEFYYSKNPTLLKIREKFFKIQNRKNDTNNDISNRITFGILCCSCYKKYYKKS